MVNYSKDDFDADTLQSDTPAPSPIPSPYPANNRRSHVPEQCPDFQTTKKVSLSSAATTPSGFVETVPKGPIKRLGATSAISFDPKVLIQPKHAIKYGTTSGPAEEISLFTYRVQSLSTEHPVKSANESRPIKIQRAVTIVETVSRET
ncbi:hypothetical protein PC117_g11011 [Phytophthora cactorum]|uniref:Uncharacterized protein n=1 Tax=Phytophthora cactorum TaxID=29920 RepID=A0A8T1DBZ1_9STRA|nr:hypothetical protein PC117_g11011 [Phytophthora cactorum]